MRALVGRQPYLAAALLGVVLTAVAIGSVEALTDRDWAISGLEWPADFVTSLLLVCLVLLVVGLIRKLVAAGRVSKVAEDS